MINYLSFEFLLWLFRKGIELSRHEGAETPRFRVSDSMSARLDLTLEADTTSVFT